MCIKITETVFSTPHKTTIKTQKSFVSIVKLFEKNKQRLRLFYVDLSEIKDFFTAEDVRSFKRYDRSLLKRKCISVLNDYLVPTHFSRRRMTNFLLLSREFNLFV